MTVDNTIKTVSIFEINKGSNKSSRIDVNAFIPHEDRRIPIDQMIYIADGPSDVPVFAVVKGMGGKTYAVYNPEDEKSFSKVALLWREVECIIMARQIIQIIRPHLCG